MHTKQKFAHPTTKGPQNQQTSTYNLISHWLIAAANSCLGKTKTQVMIQIHFLFY